MVTQGATEKEEAHLLVIPIPHHGHLIPMLRLITELSLKGTKITIVLYEDLLAGLSSTGTLSELLSQGIRFVSLSNPWPPTRNIPVEDARNLQESFKPVLEQLLEEKRSGIGAPTSILSDMFLTWAPDVAGALGIPWYMFIPSGATLARMMQETIWLLAQDKLSIAPDGKLKKFDGKLDVSGLPSMRYHELVITLRIMPAAFLNRSKMMCLAAGIVLNTASCLEGQLIEAMMGPGHRGFEENSVRKIYPVGPLFANSVNLRSIAVTRGLANSADESILWLKSQPHSSVLYVAFGTMAQLSAKEVQVLALGLQSSGQRFLWVIPQRKGAGEVETQSVMDMLPPAFQAGLGDRSHIVTGWAPQLEILAHPATGAFLTHAGWNSCMESITFGVPMICWPQWAEQNMNCRYLMDELKVADQIDTGPENVLEQKEVERAVRVLMVEPEGKEMRRRIADLQKGTAEAVAEGGSTSKAIEQLGFDIKRRMDLNE